MRRIALLLPIFLLAACAGSPASEPAPSITIFPTPTPVPTPVVPDGWTLNTDLPGISFALPPEIVKTEMHDYSLSTRSRRGDFVISITPVDASWFLQGKDPVGRIREIQNEYLMQAERDGARSTYGPITGPLAAPHGPYYVEALSFFPDDTVWNLIHTYATDGRRYAIILWMERDAAVASTSTLYTLTRLINSFSFR